MIKLENKNPKILVIGDLIIDHYLWGSCENISQEAPVQVINIDNETFLLGGAGNVVKNLIALKAEVDLISVIGECKSSEKVKALLSEFQVDTRYLISEKNRITSQKSRIIAAQQQVVRYDRESTEEISSDSQKIILKYFNKIVTKYDLILISDYGKGVMTYDLTVSLISIANKNKKKILVDPKNVVLNLSNKIFER